MTVEYRGNRQVTVVYMWGGCDSVGAFARDFATHGVLARRFLHPQHPFFIVHHNTFFLIAFRPRLPRSCFGGHRATRPHSLSRTLMYSVNHLDKRVHFCVSPCPHFFLLFNLFGQSMLDVRPSEWADMWPTLLLANSNTIFLSQLFDSYPHELKSETLSRVTGGKPLTLRLRTASTRICGFM